MLDERKILFILQKQNEQEYEACHQSIQALHVPEGYISETATWKIYAGGDRANAYNQMIQQYNAKYKIYLNENICFVNENFIIDMLNLFKNHKEIGALGIVGGNTIPSAENWQETADLYGAFYCVDEYGNPVEKKLGAMQGEYNPVQYVNSMLIATQYDISWRAGIFQTELFYNISQSMEFIRHGYSVVIPSQETPWCLCTGGDSFLDNNIDRKRFLEEYDIYLNKPADLRQIETSLHSFGYNSYIKGRYSLNFPEAIAIGDSVHIDSDAHFEVLDIDINGEPRIVINNSCHIGKRCTISVINRIVIEKYVSTAENVHIADYSYQYASVGIPIDQQDVDRGEKELIIGQSTRLESNVVIQGNVHIGRGCLVMANSVVMRDIPNYCVVAGNPARVVKFFDKEFGTWIDVPNNQQLEHFIEKRKKDKPILTIGIPTYNRSAYLNKCLEAIYDQIGDDDLFDVFVSDNASTDNTKEIVENYSKKYSNLRYNKNPQNIHDKNFEMVWTKAIGKFVVAVGDDDYFSENAIYSLINCIYENQDVSLISMLGNGSKKFQYIHDTGLDAFINRVSFVSTYISGVVMKHDLFKQIEDKEKYSETSLRQVYFQLELIKKQPAFSILYGNAFRKDAGESVFNTKNIKEESKGNLAKVFIGEYFDIVKSYLDVGLSTSVYKSDKKKVLEQMILPWCYVIKIRPTRWKIDDNILEIYDRFYKDEEYYSSGKNELEKFIAMENVE